MSSDHCAMEFEKTWTFLEEERGCSMWRPGFAEILIVLVIVILLFGPGRISKIAKELGASISAFKDGLNGENKETKPEQAAEEDTKKED